MLVIPQPIYEIDIPLSGLVLVNSHSSSKGKGLTWGIILDSQICSLYLRLSKKQGSLEDV